MKLYQWFTGQHPKYQYGEGRALALAENINEAMENVRQDVRRYITLTHDADEVDAETEKYCALLFEYPPSVHEAPFATFEFTEN